MSAYILVNNNLLLQFQDFYVIILTINLVIQASKTEDCEKMHKKIHFDN